MPLFYLFRVQRQCMCYPCRIKTTVLVGGSLSLTYLSMREMVGFIVDLPEADLAGMLEYVDTRRRSSVAYVRIDHRKVDKENNNADKERARAWLRVDES